MSQAIKIVEKNRPRNFQSLYQKQRESEKGEAINPQLEKIRKEIAILKKCDHPHVVKLKEVIDDPAAEKIYLVLEYVAGSDVHWRRGDFDTASPVLTLDESRRIFRDVLCGVQYLHFQGIVHRDIKPANLLQTPTGRIKISDFGVSVFIRPKVDGGLKKKKSTNTWSSETSEDVMPSMGAELAKTQGSPAFLAPELCAIGEDYYALMKSKSFYEKDQSSLGKGIDVWAIGVTLYCLVFGKLPFFPSSGALAELYSLIVNKE
ncbi:kinase-like domain-containing protein [Polychytrium aggregatum]|uniref:kinase-like domain-containing protein n=1 Tax=Polychytrium aggregatum TaxID=110093 RepID=UPI0022FEC2DC|nr:kinase-like domain-containing protein [Polychytrium aggregatum]KAI9206130.1 kinase-like domain-containing protein [Polychytrium aggregatum]